MRSAEAKTAERLRRRGFDKAHVDRGSGYVRVGCSQCSACAVNGVAIHERGCPNDRE